MDTTYQQVLAAKRGEILAEIELLRREAGGLAFRLSLKEGQLKNIDDLLALEKGEISPNDARDAPQAERRGVSLSDQAAEVLRIAAKPTHYRQIVGLLAERDVYVPGKDPGANLIAHIARDARFVRTGRGMYALAQWPSVNAAKVVRTKKRAVRKPRKRPPRAVGSEAR